MVQRRLSKIRAVPAGHSLRYYTAAIEPSVNCHCSRVQDLQVRASNAVWEPPCAQGHAAFFGPHCGFQTLNLSRQACHVYATALASMHEIVIIHGHFMLFERVKHRRETSLRPWLPSEAFDLTSRFCRSHSGLCHRDTAKLRFISMSNVGIPRAEETRAL